MHLTDLKLFWLSLDDWFLKSLFCFPSTEAIMQAPNGWAMAAVPAPEDASFVFPTGGCLQREVERYRVQVVPSAYLMLSTRRCK